MKYLLVVLLITTILALVTIFYRYTYKPNLNVSKTIQTNAQLEKPIIENLESSNTSICGKITIDYVNIPNYQSTKDELYVFILDSSSKEDPYSAPLCATDDNKKENCIWLVEKVGTKRIYEYKLLFDGMAPIKTNSNYKLTISDRVYKETFENVGSVQGEGFVLTQSGNTTKDFNLEAHNLLN